MPAWLHESLTYAVLAVTVLWLLYRLVGPTERGGCSHCPAAEPASRKPSTPATAVRSPALRVVE